MSCMFSSCVFQVSPVPKRRRYKSYSPTMLTNTYLDVLEKKTSVYKAAKKYAVPEKTLRDRIIGKVDPENTRSGPEPVFTQKEEARLVIFYRLQLWVMVTSGLRLST